MLPMLRRAETMVIEPEERVSEHPMLINGELVQSSSGLSDPVINPATGAPTPPAAPSRLRKTSWRRRARGRREWEDS